MQFLKNEFFRSILSPISLFLLLSIFSVHFLFAKFQPLLVYDRLLVIENSEYWRLVTCHFVHWNFIHLLVNSAGILIAVQFINNPVNIIHYIVIFLLVVLVGASLPVFSEISHYAGFSSIIYGWIIFSILQNNRFSSLVSTLFVSAIFVKLSLELIGILSTASMSGLIASSVATPVHLVAAATGLLLFWIFVLSGISSTSSNRKFRS